MNELIKKFKKIEDTAAYRLTWTKYAEENNKNIQHDFSNRFQNFLNNKINTGCNNTGISDNKAAESNTNNTPS